MITSRELKELGESMKIRMAHNISSYENWERSVLKLNLPKENTVWLLEFYKVAYLKQEPSPEFIQAMIDND
ncbi:MAG: hypothetical protein JO154_25180 [Chitinophaga sp.]|uniref:hypothetical protein n=1 Tax=Chitinophaga sp. TaxID=1869181 RepID=UPI0025C3C0FF|nr:hypothetical protein [Chitinophaga sp.]MBV8255913.1 hypothetical protein [Chitinophaga sp.]